MIIPERISLISLILGFTATTSRALFLNQIDIIGQLIEHLAASIYSLLLMLSIKLVSEKITKRKCLGIGDVKIASMGGAWLGLNGNLIALMMSFLSAGIVSFFARLSMRMKPYQSFPFAPYLCFFFFGVWVLGEDWWIQNFLPL